MICSKCGTKSADQAKFCTNCGETFAKPNNQPGAPDPMKKKKLRLKLRSQSLILQLQWMDRKY